MDIICIHSDDKIREIIKDELDDLGFEFRCFSKPEEARKIKAYVALTEFKKDNTNLIKGYPLVIPVIRTTNGNLSYEFERKRVEYITVDSLKNFKQRLMKILLKNKDKIGELASKDKFQKNIVYAYGFDWGKTYTVNIDKSLKIYSFLRGLSDKIPVFLATRERPNILVRGKNIRSVWITDILGKGRIRPHNLTVLTDIITRFLGEGEKRIVVIDCIEYMLLYNDLINVLRNLELINSYAMEYKSLVILIIDENSYSQREISLLRRYSVKWNGGV